MWAEEGALLVLRRTQYLTIHTADDAKRAHTFALALRVARLMDGLPLALDQAGAYIEETQCALSDFLSLLQTYPLAVLDERNRHADYPFSVTKTFALAYEQLCREHHTAADLLALCCFLAPEPIPEESIIRGAVYLDAPLGKVVADAWQFNEALRHALDYALLQRNPEKQTLSMHPLAQMVLRHHLDAPTRKYWAHQALQLISGSLLSLPSGRWETYEPLLPHALAVFHCLEETQSAESGDEGGAAEVATLQMRLASYLATQGRYDQAAALAQRSQHLYERYPTAMRPELTRSLLDLADFYAFQGKDSEAQRYYEHALAIQEQVLGATHPDVTATRIGLALLHATQGRCEEATSLLLPVATRRQNEPTDPAFQGVLVNYLANLLAKQERFEEAETHFQQALTLWQRTASAACTASRGQSGSSKLSLTRCLEFG
jgi:tetratricopeptide (TPR) repeat protein